MLFYSFKKNKIHFLYGEFAPLGSSCSLPFSVVLYFKLGNIEMISKPDIIIVDDHLTFRKGLISILTIEDIATVIGEASDGEEFIELLSHLTPDVVLMDIDMPKMNGINATKKALELLPGLKIIAYTMYSEGEYYSKMIDLGVKGFILKSGGINELEKAIKEVMNGNSYFLKYLAQKIKKTTGDKETGNTPENAKQTDKEIAMNAGSAIQI